MRHSRTYPLLFTILMVVLFSTTSEGQLRFGFFGGLNSSQLMGPQEMVEGAEGESISAITGFHIGMRARYEINDWMDVGAGIGYMQRGLERNYDGPSYQYFVLNNGTETFFTGQKEYRSEINSDHLDLPVFIQFRPLKKVKLYLGPYVSYMMSATGVGVMRFNETSFSGDGNQVEIGLEHNYFNDKAGQDVDLNSEQITIDGERALVPEVYGAYDDRSEGFDKLYRRWDFGAHAGVNLFLSSGLYFNFEFMYGLTDITRDSGDVSLAMRNAEMSDFIYHEDFDRFISYKFSVGFSF